MRWRITDKLTGQSMVYEGDQVPTRAELDFYFGKGQGTNAPAPAPAVPPTVPPPTPPAAAPAATSRFANVLQDAVFPPWIGQGLSRLGTNEPSDMARAGLTFAKWLAPPGEPPPSGAPASQYPTPIGPPTMRQYPVPIGPEVNINLQRENPLAYAARTPLVSNAVSWLRQNVPGPEAREVAGLVGREAQAVGQQALDTARFLGGQARGVGQHALDTARYVGSGAQWLGSGVADLATSGVRDLRNVGRWLGSGLVNMGREAVTPVIETATQWAQRNLTAPPPPNKVRVIAPDGTRGIIDVSELELAKRNGYVIVE